VELNEIDAVQKQLEVYDSLSLWIAGAIAVLGLFMAILPFFRFSFVKNWDQTIQIVGVILAIIGIAQFVVQLKQGQCQSIIDEAKDKAFHDELAAVRAEETQSAAAIDRMRQPRNLPTGGSDRFNARLKDFAGQSVKVCVLRPSDESDRLRGQIIHALTCSGLKAEPAALPPQPAVNMYSIPGVATLAQGNNPEARKLAEALAEALNGDGVAAQFHPFPLHTNTPVYVVVREKPQ
jgi:hypothetical protein